MTISMVQDPVSQVYRIYMDISARELHSYERQAQDLIANRVETMATMIVDRIVNGMDLDKLIRGQIKEVVRERVVVAVDERLDEFFGEDD